MLSFVYFSWGVAARGGCLGVATEHGSNNDIGELQQGAGYYLTLLFFTNNTL